MFRNREIRQFAVLLALITAASVAAGFAVHPAAGILALVTAIAFGTAFFLFTKARYRSIARITDQIDLVLHNAGHMFISESDEGELSILQSEITKMTLRIREQNEKRENPPRGFSGRHCPSAAHPPHLRETHSFSAEE